MLSVKQGASSTIFLVFWHDLDWTLVTQTIGKHFNHYANRPIKIIYIYIYIYKYTKHHLHIHTQ